MASKVQFFNFLFKEELDLSLSPSKKWFKTKCNSKTQLQMELKLKQMPMENKIQIKLLSLLIDQSKSKIKRVEISLLLPNWTLWSLRRVASFWKKRRMLYLRGRKKLMNGLWAQEKVMPLLLQTLVITFLRMDLQMVDYKVFKIIQVHSINKAQSTLTKRAWQNLISLFSQTSKMMMRMTIL